jgi:hypothetical protein
MHKRLVRKTLLRGGKGVFPTANHPQSVLIKACAAECASCSEDARAAASVAASGFKPGPMGDRGLGQLAYDKGMRILAATQADDFALESGDVGQGLLTYALVCEGLGLRFGGGRGLRRRSSPGSCT